MCKADNKKLQREKGQLIRTCLKKIIDDATSSHKYSIANIEKEKENNNAEPEVTLKYPEFIHFNTDGILKGTDQGFEVVSDGDRYRLEYMFKESTGNILDLNKLRKMQSSFIENYFEGLNQNQDTRKYEMVRYEEDVNQSEVHTFQEFVGFLNLIKNDDVVSKGWELYRDRFVKVLKWFYSHYLQRQLPRPIPPIIHGIPIHLFDLYKLIECMGGYLSVHFGQEFGALPEILGLTRSDGEDIRKCYMVYLDVFTSYYKIARAPKFPARADEDSSLESYQWTFSKISAPLASQKGKEKIEHFGIKLEDEENCIEQQSAHHEENEITSYRCHNFGHYSYQCPSKLKDHGNYKSYKEPPTSRTPIKEIQAKEIQVNTLTSSLEVYQDMKAYNLGRELLDIKIINLHSYLGADITDIDYRYADAIFNENRFSSVPRPSLRIPNGTKNIGGLVVPEEVTEEVVQQPEPELRKKQKE
ncbi:ARID DNA-binding domain-containing protein [Tanacetum coccineum]